MKLLSILLVSIPAVCVIILAAVGVARLVHIRKQQQNGGMPPAADDTPKGDTAPGKQEPPPQ